MSFSKLISADIFEKKYHFEDFYGKDPHIVFLVDLSWVLYRNYYAFSNFSVSIDGETYPTGHLYGLSRMVQLLQNRFPNGAIVLVVDGYPEEKVIERGEYKSGREHAFKAHDSYMDVVRLMSNYKAVSFCYDSSKEADDVMGALASKMSSMGKQVLVHSGDNDMLQLIDLEGVELFRQFKGGLPVKLGLEYLRDKFFGLEDWGLLPYCRALIGDKSDNLPGIPRLDRKFVLSFAKMWRKNGFDAALRQDYGKRTCSEKVREQKNKVLSNFRLMKLDVFVEDLHALIPKRVYTDILDLYQLNSVKRYSYLRRG